MDKNMIWMDFESNERTLSHYNWITWWKKCFMHNEMNENTSSTIIIFYSFKQLFQIYSIFKYIPWRAFSSFIVCMHACIDWNLKCRFKMENWFYSRIHLFIFSDSENQKTMQTSIVFTVDKYACQKILRNIRCMIKHLEQNETMFDPCVRM